MRDPDLVVRAQQAATALESAWRRWRSLHGLGAEPAPPVSSYVGYSLEAPWGQARIVFGICAEEAEQLAALLRHHDCVGPVHASVTASPAGQSRGGGAPSQPAAAFVHVPPPAPASGTEQSRPAGPAPDRAERPRHRDPLAAASLISRGEAATACGGTPIALAASQAVAAATASRQQAAAKSSAERAEPVRSVAPAQPREPAKSPEPAKPAAPVAEGASSERTPGESGAERDARAVTGSPGIVAFRPRPEAAPGPRGQQDERLAAGRAESSAPQFGDAETNSAHRGPGGPSWTRLKCQGPVSDHDPATSAESDQAQPTGRPQDSRDRLSSSAAAADAVAWAASELPGQAAVTDTAV